MDGVLRDSEVRCGNNSFQSRLAVFLVLALEATEIYGNLRRQYMGLSTHRDRLELRTILIQETRNRLRAGSEGLGGAGF